MLNLSLRNSTLAFVAAISIQTLGLPSWAQVAPVTIQDVVNSMSDADLVTAANEQLAVDHAQVRLARAGYLPTITAAVGPQIANGKYSNATSITILQPLYTGGVVKAQDQRADAQRVANAHQGLVRKCHQRVSADHLLQGIDQAVHHGGIQADRDQVDEDLGIRGGL